MIPPHCAALLAAFWLTGAPPPQTLDDFESLDAWSVSASEGVSASIRSVQGTTGRALCLDFDFHGSAGFCVVRRELPLTLPPNYRFTFAVRGTAPRNNLEFKLVDASGENVWWVNRRDFEFPEAWTTLSQKARHFRFAWGPSGGTPLTAISAIEFAVAASEGGPGNLCVDDLSFEPLPEPQPAAEQPWAHVSSGRLGLAGGPDRPVPVVRDVVAWKSDPQDPHPSMRIDFRQFRALGGVMLEWATTAHAPNYEIALTDDGERWRTVATVTGSIGGRDYIPLPDEEARQLRITMSDPPRDGVRLQSVRVLDTEFGDSPNAMYATIARESPRGWYPRYFLDEQQPWTIVGAAGDSKEALVDTGGAIEVDKRAFRIEPILRVGTRGDRRVVTWADAQTSYSLAAGCLPIPSVRWAVQDLTLDVTALAAGPAGRSSLVIRYRLTNLGEHALGVGTLYLSIRPFQVLPPWQDLNITGGVAPIRSVAWDGVAATVNDVPRVTPWIPPREFFAATFAQGDIIEHISRSANLIHRTTGYASPPLASPPTDTDLSASPADLLAPRIVTDPDRRASAALAYDFELKPGEHATYVLSIPFHADAEPLPVPADPREAEVRFEQLLEQTRADWSEKISRVELRLPPEAQHIVDTFKATQAYILINADGPAIQPGSRTYERSWIRDGALTSTALLYTGHAEQVRAFIEWYAPHQYASGKIPCVVDHRGADPVPEHDSTGEFIYLLLKYYRFTQDRALLEQQLPRVVAGVDYLESLRNQRLTAAYRDGPPEMRACYGLVPESISHEGYSAKPMHSYWDSFFVLRGLRDATTIAEILDRQDLARRFARLRDDYRHALYESLDLAMRRKHIDYIPGCVELGDFDATSTAIAVFPGAELGHLPEPALTNTFERYWEFFRNRRAGAHAWENYTPYELRIVGTMIRLGRPQRAHELLEFFLLDQAPAAWCQWAEIVWRDPDAPRFIGDLPHTWVGSAYLNAVRSMFVYEDEGSASLVLAAGVPLDWLTAPGGVSVEHLPTEHGLISYDLHAEGSALLLSLRGDGAVPPGGVVLRLPPEARVLSVQADDGVPAAIGGDGVRLNGLPARIVVQIAP